MSELAIKITLPVLREMKRKGEKFACLTAYDASFARLLETSGVEVLLVGDSLGMVIQGQETTIPVTVGEMVYHTRCVSRASDKALIMADMPFMSDAAPDQALANAARLMQEGGAHMVKIEGGAVMYETVHLLAERGIPVCAHLGLLPQSIHKLGGYRVQGREAQAAEQMHKDAAALVEAGADILLLECVPSELARKIATSTSVPVIGIGAGSACDGQVLVLYDMLGITPGKKPKFVHDFLRDLPGGSVSIAAAVGSYVQAIKKGDFPTPEQNY